MEENEDMPHMNWGNRYGGSWNCRFIFNSLLTGIVFLVAIAAYSHDSFCDGNDNSNDVLVIAAKKLNVFLLEAGQPKITMEQWVQGLTEEGETVCWQVKDNMEILGGYTDVSEPWGVGVEVRVGTSSSNYFLISIIMAYMETEETESVHIFKRTLPRIGYSYYKNGEKKGKRLRSGFPLADLKEIIQTKHLIKAIDSGNFALVKKIVKDGASINSKDEQGSAPLHKAILAGSAEMVVFLVSNGADVNLQNSWGVPPLRIATDLEIFKFLVSNGADINSINGYGETVLHYLAFQGDTEKCQLLVSKGCNLDAKDRRGNAAVHVAAEKGNLDVVKMLVEKGANIKSPNKEGKTPFKLAKENQRKNVVDFLLSKGAK